jgi:hypothetical protein
MPALQAKALSSNPRPTKNKTRNKNPNDKVDFIQGTLAISARVTPMEFCSRGEKMGSILNATRKS